MIQFDTGNMINYNSIKKYIVQYLLAISPYSKQFAKAPQYLYILTYTRSSSSRVSTESFGRYS